MQLIVLAIIGCLSLLAYFMYQDKAFRENLHIGQEVLVCEGEDEIFKVQILHINGIDGIVTVMDRNKNIWNTKINNIYKL